MGSDKKGIGEGRKIEMMEERRKWKEKTQKGGRKEKKGNAKKTRKQKWKTERT